MIREDRGYRDIADRMFLLRKSVGKKLTQTFFGKMVGVDQATVSFWESHDVKQHRDPTWDQMLRIKTATTAGPYWITQGTITDISPDLLEKIENLRSELVMEARQQRAPKRKSKKPKPI